MISRRILQSYSRSLYFRRSAVNASILNKQDLENVHLVNVRGMAGHSKWANIKHTKEAKDLARSQVFTKLARIIKVAISAGKSANPKANDYLANAIEEAKRQQMPVAKIEAIIKGEADKPSLNYVMELVGPGGCFMIIDIQTDSIPRTKNNLKFEFNKIGTPLNESNVMHAFDRKGIIQVDPKASGINIDNAVDVAIEVGAEDVIETVADDDTKVLQFVCDPREHHIVRTELVKRGCEVVSTELTYLAKHKVPLREGDMKTMEKLMSVLNEREYVAAIYDNVE
ncbi:Translational activator of mitochondrially encoded cytochrome c oxidase I [Chamberlinius hualienensis]